jgi:hypothetical protein
MIGSKFVPLMKRFNERESKKNNESYTAYGEMKCDDPKVQKTNSTSHSTHAPAQASTPPTTLNKTTKGETSDKPSKQVTTGIGPFTDSIINACIEKLTCDDVKKKITDDIVAPLIQTINDRLEPYIYIVSTLYVLIVIMLIIIIYLVLTRK